MRKSKIERLNSDIEQLEKRLAESKEKTAELQKKLRMLETERNELKDAETLALVRSEKISDAELNELIRSIRDRRQEKEAPADSRLKERARLRQEVKDNAIEEEN